MDNQNQTPVDQTSQAGTPATATTSPSMPPQSSPPSTPPTTSPSQTPSDGQPSYMLFIAVAVVVIIAIIGGLIFMGIRQTEEKTSPARPTTQPTIATSPTPEVTAEPSLSSSDEIEAIDKDTQATDVDSLDQELSAISKESQSL